MKPAAVTGAHSRRVPPEKRKRTETSCDKCKSRKQKCRREPDDEACRYCVAHKIECLTTQPRKKRLYGSVEGLGNRLALLESLVKGLLPEADVGNVDELRQLGYSLGIPLPDHDDGEARAAADSADDGEDGIALLPDQQGQVQYIGPASSFAFHLKMRDLLGHAMPRAFSLFGKNAAAEQEGGDEPEPKPSQQQSQAHTLDRRASMSTSTATASSDVPSLDSLIGVYFEHINPDCHILHEPSFREAYEAWLARPESADPVWLCSFLCVLLLARRVARLPFPQDQERLWWARVQTLLPVVIFTSNIMAVQALMLAAVHLHNTNHRDACWNLTGTAVRIAFAIGLHQDKVSSVHTPLARELCRRLWWSLYAYEVMQVSSYDRPASLDHSAANTACPNERLIGTAAYTPPDYAKWYNRLMVHLSSACRAPKTVKPHAADDSYVGPLSPAAAVLRDLDRWRSLLPHHLRMDALDAAPPAFHRPLLLLHSLHHYSIYVICRAAMLARATTLAKEGQDSPNTALTAMSDTCADSGRILARIMLRLDAIGKFDAITHWDCWYSLAAASILVLDLVCLDRLPGADSSHPRLLLSQLAHLATRHRRNRYMPPTLARFASIIPELQSMVSAMNTSSSPPLAPSSSATPATDARSEPHDANPEPMRPPPPLQTHQDVPYPFPQSSTNSNAYNFPGNIPVRYYPDQGFTGEPALYPNTRFDRSSQMNFMDFTVNNIQDWNWGDFGSFLGNDGAQSMPNIHNPAPPGPS
ncbi:hypothetical protein P153DRAFT_280429 [Dothidotthia symphoricarpi CBS 119687]|uniref:Zn(2)-C6 fungal-type domain-containing protein n=1 Tax=Dothidotthia symphoricarpi CBS 119687 TaxID=1392245 RepID=A0A6A6ARL2_9PLEO|nr:uncharacterized protein P153DRAFT_280429 [Dothidotthia symphoricarpi CBS 119687]KAF2134186.1 hypothetical protein P153DRAFT_280429 [Dothidotthia symphoricarpi CBS 119687]